MNAARPQENRTSRFRDRGVHAVSASDLPAGAQMLGDLSGWKPAENGTSQGAVTRLLRNSQRQQEFPGFRIGIRFGSGIQPVEIRSGPVYNIAPDPPIA
jgi:hypothetical protein